MDSYTQPIAVFTYNGPSHRNNLAQLVIQAVVKLEKAGAGLTNGLRYYQDIVDELADCESTAEFCETFNALFDALNITQPDKEIRIDCDDLNVNTCS